MDNPTNAALWIAGAQAVAVAIVGLATSLIAWKQAQINERQAQTNEHKLNLDNYDRWLRVYQQVVIYLSKAVQNRDVSIDSIAALRSATIEVPFLFSTEIEKYVNELVRHGLRLGTAKEEYRDYTQEQPADYDHAAVCKALNEETLWFNDQFDVVKDKFRKELLGIADSKKF